MQKHTRIGWIHFRKISSAEWGGVFNHQLFAPSTPAHSLSEMRSRLTLVPSEFDLLQFQSVAARLAELEGLRPQAGYVKVAALGLGAIDGMTVKALHRMPLVIRDLARQESGYRIVEELRQTVNTHVTLLPNGVTLDNRLRDATRNDAEQVLLQLASAKALVTRPFSAVRTDIDYWRGMEGEEAKKFQAHPGHLESCCKTSGSARSSFTTVGWRMSSRNPRSFLVRAFVDRVGHATHLVRLMLSNNQDAAGA